MLARGICLCNKLTGFDSYRHFTICGGHQRLHQHSKHIRIQIHTYFDWSGNRTFELRLIDGDYLVSSRLEWIFFWMNQINTSESGRSAKSSKTNDVIRSINHFFKFFEGNIGHIPYDDFLLVTKLPFVKFKTTFVR